MVSLGQKCNWVIYSENWEKVFFFLQGDNGNKKKEKEKY